MHDNSARNAFGQTVTTVPTTRPAPSLLEMRGIRFMVPEAPGEGAGDGGNAGAGAGAAGTGGENAQNGGQGGEGGDNSAGAGTGAGNDGKGAENGAQSDVKFEDLDEKTKAFVLRDRKQAQTERQAREVAEQKLADQRKAMGKMLGYEKDEEVDVDKLGGELSATKAENAVLRHGAKLVDDVDALLDSRAFTTALGKLQTTDKAAVTSLIESFLDDHPSYKPKPSGGGSSGTGGSGNGGQQSEKRATSLAGAVANALAGNSNK